MQLRLGDTARLFAAVAIFLTIGNQAFTDTKAKPVPLDWQTLPLKYGWAFVPGVYREPAVAIDAGNIVHLRGAAGQPTGNDNEAFTLPSAYRPAAVVVVPVMVAGGKPGYLYINPEGVVKIFTETYAAAQHLTTLEGATFSKDGASPTP